MMFCGVVIFKEKLGLHQKIGLVILIIGLILFFNERADQLFDINIYSIGVFLSMSASLTGNLRPAKKITFTPF